MNIFIAGICGTFMTGIAQLARELGHRVRGCDANVYPPMSEVLADAGITVHSGYDPAHIDADTDQVVIGNALSRGNPLVEAVLDDGMVYRSGPAWLAEHVLARRRVIAMAGTHGKTSTASMIAWILESAGRSPGFLIGGKPGNFRETARLGGGVDFVIEADEYDTAFFDKRSKFVHYSPAIAVLSNLEFDHADIFDNVEQIRRQFHHLIRIVPRKGSVVVNADDANLSAVLDLGLWSRRVDFSLESPHAEWHAVPTGPSTTSFDVMKQGEVSGTVRWDCIGTHNLQNALAAVAASSEAGIDPRAACEALAQYRPSARRLQCLHRSSRAILFEDFAHHPTAIARTLEALHAHYPGHRLVAILEPGSNTMRMGHDPGTMGRALSLADETILYRSAELSWDPLSLPGADRITVIDEPEAAVSLALKRATGGAVVVAMSNGGFGGIPRKLANVLDDATGNPSDDEH
ncbi:MAG: UDP-N-acetylmuramate:L-alanyl-gamma-D-glutamyl-meso-diaminopimelate ligase [Gammaproteobacteria bacterium]|nr:UDP-N-acetylmuramate:L-alanyl-gamma-D-glutamyl-meso-diaminopimelate ligase [Gammaproteobacteria bacterium]